MFRTYFSKDTTLIKNTLTNTANNPVTELFYGFDKMSSRYIFNFDIENIRINLIQKSVQATQNIKHELKVYNSGFFDDTRSKQEVNGRYRASSVDIVLFKIPSGQTWNEGSGYDFVYGDTDFSINSTFIDEPANWYNRTTLNGWTENGIYSGLTSANYIPLKIFNLDKGNEHLIIDITDEVKKILSGGTWNEGFGLSFIPQIEEVSTINNYTSAFFTSKTNTFFEPFIETTYTQDIQDDRNNFILGRTNKLYLYSNVNHSPKDLDQLPTSVNILDQNGALYLSTTGVTKEAKGIYSVSLNIPITVRKNVIYTDVWQGLMCEGTTLENRTMEFMLRPQTDYYNIGDKTYDVEDYKLNFYGIDRGEVILDNEERKIVVEARPFYNLKKEVIINELYYRIYVKQGSNQIDIVKKNSFFRTADQNYFILDTSWMKEHEYFLEISSLSNGITKNIGNINFFIQELGINNY